jgi:hypothetical protein
MLGEAEVPRRHYWSMCPLCGWMVVCGKCGNNCCNGGYGTVATGHECDACPSAYDMQSKGIGAPTNPFSWSGGPVG